MGLIMSIMPKKVISNIWRDQNMKFRDICNNSEVILKRSEISVGRQRYCSYYCGLLSTFIIEGNDKFIIEGKKLEVS